MRLFGAKGFQDDFPLLWRVWIDARLSVGGWKDLEKIPIEKIALDQTIDSRVLEHSAQTTVDETVTLLAFRPLAFCLFCRVCRWDTLRKPDAILPKGYLGYELRFQPYAVFHLFSR